MIINPLSKTLIFGHAAKRGSQLSPSDQQQVLSRYIHRFTGDHRPQWASKLMPNGKRYPLQFTNDQEWLHNTLFAVRKNGQINNKYNYCESHATWPQYASVEDANLSLQDAKTMRQDRMKEDVSDD